MWIAINMQYARVQLYMHSDEIYIYSQLYRQLHKKMQLTAKQINKSYHECNTTTFILNNTV